jgi:general secretion pathway protein K
VTELAADRERGIAIVAALWAAAILAVIVGSVLQLVRADAGLGHGRQEAAELGAVVDGAVNLTILALLAPTGAQWPVNGSPMTLPFAGHEIRVSVEDESGKLDLNAVGAATLQRLFASVGLETDAARRLAENVVNWPERSPSDTASDRRPRGARFQSVEDLQLVAGMTPEIYRRAAPLLTVYSQTPWIDPAYSTPAVLALFRESDANAEAALRRIEEERAGLRAPAQAPGVSLGHAFTITAELRTPTAARIVRIAVVRLTGQARVPLLIYRWS